MTEYIILLPLIIQLLGLTPVVLLDSYIQKNRRRTMLIIIVFIALMIIVDVADYVLSTSISMPYIRTLVSILGYILRPTIIVLFCELVSPNRKHYFGWILVLINAAIYLTASFSPVTFYINEDNRFQRGPLGYTAFVISALLLAYFVYCTALEHRRRKASVWIAIANESVIIVSVILEISPAYHDYPVSYLTIAVVSCSLFYYIWLHIEFVRVHENALKAEQRIKIMMSQIQPHFLYNTLSTIQALCLIDPKKASGVTEQFGTYLRRNLDSLNESGLISLSKELEHTKIYAEIEMLRFSKITVNYDIQCEEFYVPALTIQPLVENAIRHGVRSRQHGIVTVATSEDNAYYMIVISDNGIGFNPESVSKAEGDHIGIANVTERIKTMCNGTVDIDSRIDEGTVITIRIPKQEKK